MNKFFSSITIGLLLAGVCFGAQDHNSSRSNKTSSINAPKETETLLREAGEDAYAVTKTMLENDQKRDRYQGDYEITVEVKVKVERAGKTGAASGK